MLVLALDTSTYLGTVAVLRDGALLAEISAFVRATHGETLLPHLSRALELAGAELSEVDLLAVGIGPGSFTGVRIGLATAKGLALAERKPLVGITSLRVLARGIGHGPGLAVPVLDAHKGEVYCAAYERDEAGALRERLAPFHAPPAEAAERVRRGAPSDTLWLAGDGLLRYSESFLARLGPHVVRAPRYADTPRAACLAHEAQERFTREGPSDLARLEPLYLRPSDAKLPGGIGLDTSHST